jgi:hypothetical protein
MTTCNQLIPCTVPVYTLPELNPINFNSYIIDYNQFVSCICPPPVLPPLCQPPVNYTILTRIALNNLLVLVANIVTNLGEYLIQFLASFSEWLLNIIAYILCSIGNYNRFIITTLVDNELLADNKDKIQTPVAKWLFSNNDILGFGKAPLPIARNTSNPQNFSLDLEQVFGINNIRNTVTTTIKEQQDMIKTLLSSDKSANDESSIKKIDVKVFTDDLSTKIDGVFTQFNNGSADELAVLKSAVLEVAEKVVTDVNENL